MEDREIEKAFASPGGLMDAAQEALRYNRAQAVKILEGLDIPHLGDLAESDALWHLVRLVNVRSMEQPGKGKWARALAKTRQQAQRTLMGNSEANADAWKRAHAEAQRKAAARFLRDTERLVREGF